MKAFPSTHNNISIHEGMELRDWFAGKAVQGQMVNSPIFGGVGNSQSDFAKAVAQNAYAVADAMMEARKICGK